MAAWEARRSYDFVSLFVLVHVSNRPSFAQAGWECQEFLHWSRLEGALGALLLLLLLLLHIALGRLPFVLG